MRSQKTISLLICLLIGSFVLSGVPVFVSEDANQDRRIDLKDAVLHAQKMETDRMNHAEKTCLNTLQAVAGDKEIAPGSFETDELGFTDLCFLIPETGPVYSRILIQSIDDIVVLFKSSEWPPLCEPPIHA